MISDTVETQLTRRHCEAVQLTSYNPKTQLKQVELIEINY